MTDKVSTLNEFKKELKALLDKYNASIEVGCSDCSDLHGVYDKHLLVTVPPIMEGKSASQGIPKVLCDGWELYEDEIELDDKVVEFVEVLK